MTERRQDYAKMILELRRVGFSAADIERWGRSAGRTFTASAVESIVLRNSERPSEEIAATITDLHERLFHAK